MKRKFVCAVCALFLLAGILLALPEDAQLARQQGRGKTENVKVTEEKEERGETRGITEREREGTQRFLVQEEEAVVVQIMDGQGVEAVMQTMRMQEPALKQQIMSVQLSVTEAQVTGGAAIRFRADYAPSEAEP